MIDQNTKGLLKVTLESIANTSAKSFQHSQVQLTVGITTYLHDQQLNIKSNGASLTIGKIFMFDCAKQDCMELLVSSEAEGSKCYAKFPLEKLRDMPRVKHEIDVIMPEYNQQKAGVVVQPLNPLLELSLSVVYFNGLIGRFTVHSIEAHLIRNTEALGKMDLFSVLQIQDTKKETAVQKNQGQHGVWTTKFQFQITKVNTSLKISVWDKNPVKNSLVGENQFHMLKAGLLKPTDRIMKYSTNLQFNGQIAGFINIDYTFQIVSAS